MLNSLMVKNTHSDVTDLCKRAIKRLCLEFTPFCSWCLLFRSPFWKGSIESLSSITTSGLILILQTLSNQLQCFSFTIIHIPSASICNLISSLFCGVSNICDMRKIIKFLTTSLRFSVIVLPNHLLRDVCTENRN